MAHTRTWNAAYEADPADGDVAKEGAQRIQDLKKDLRERLAQDHSWDAANPDDTNDGFHTKVTLLEQAGNPATKADTMQVFAKEFEGITELYTKNSAGTVLQLTKAGALKALTTVNVWSAGNAMTPVVLTDGATVTPNLNLGGNFTWIIGGNRTLANPSNLVDGAVIAIMVKQDGTGGRTITYGSLWDFPNGVDAQPADGASDYSLITGIYSSTFSRIFTNIAKNFVNP